ncbi:MAG: hypothetical protein GWN16_13240 [Calditrichae bacterium]|nr:hypothetical protein [Calditrichia bacterium]NIW80352.1 hypothetical protein [Calditrichia bacterium]
MSFNQQALRQTNQLMTILKADRLQSDSIGLLMATMAQSELFRPITSTYESIKSSGNLGVISNYNLKETIVKYYQYYEYSRVLEEVSERFINQYIFPFFYENFDMMSGDFINRERLNDIKFRNLIVGYRGMTAQNLEFYKEVRAACKDLQGQLATELKKTGLFTPQNSLTGK